MQYDLLAMKPRMGLILVLLLIIAPICVHIGRIPIIQWDESRLAMNALEMYDNGNWIVTYYKGAPDLWNTKPPLLIWMQTTSMHLFGITEWALRVPTMIAALCTCLLLYWFVAMKIRKPFFAVLAVLVLVTSEGFLRNHVGRTADYDTLLVLFMLASCIFIYLFVEEEENRVRNLYLFFLSLTLAFMTKGIPSIIFLPAIFLYVLWRRRLMLLIKNKHTYIGAAAFLLVVVSWYLIREHYGAGYIKAVIYNDVTGRYLHTDQTNGNDMGFYQRLMRKKLFNYWWLMIIPGMILGGMHKDERVRHVSIYAGLLAVFHFLVISKAQTKNEWYDAAIYPFWALVVGVGLYTICELLVTQVNTGNTLRKNVLPLALLSLAFLRPYGTIVKHSVTPVRYADSYDDESMGYYLKRIYHDKMKMPDAAIVWDREEANVLWYLRVLERERRPIAYLEFAKLSAGNKVMAYQPGVKHYIEDHYDARVVETSESVNVYQINGPKQEVPAIGP